MDSYQAILRALPLPLAVSALSGIVTLLSPLSASAPFIASAIGVLVFIEKYLSTLEAQAPVTTVGVISSTPPASTQTSTPAPTPPSITYSIQGQPITVTPNLPIGTNDQRGNGLSVGQQTPNQFIGALGGTIPANAIYLGNGQWEFNGNMYQAN
jgi:hypothetical protein